jgi:predicted metal-dependent peptidase
MKTTSASISPSLLKLSKARIQLLFGHPFFASLCLRLVFIADQVETMETDGRAIYYSDKYVESLTPDELAGVLAHEALHCALAHHCRRGKRTEQRWNEACDYAVNPILLQNQLTLPAGALLKKEFEGLSAEEIYSRLPHESQGGSQSPETDSGDAGGSSGDSQQQQQSSGNNSGNGEGSGQKKPSADNGSASGPQEPKAGGCQSRIGDVRDAAGENGAPASDAEKSEEEHKWAVAAAQAAQAAKVCGHAPAGVDQLLEESRRSKKDWRSILREFVAATTPSDYRFCPPNRRHIHAGLYLPSIRKEGTGRVVIAVDTSGSIGRAELEEFAGEISAVCEEAQPEIVYVVYCDAAVQSVQEFSPAETVALKPKGGGGTDFRPVFKWVEENDVRPACLIYLTDLACHKFPERPPDYPVLWVTDSRKTAPFGETLEIVTDL